MPRALGQHLAPRSPRRCARPARGRTSSARADGRAPARALPRCARGRPAVSLISFPHPRFGGGSARRSANSSMQARPPRSGFSKAASPSMQYQRASNSSPEPATKGHEDLHHLGLADPVEPADPLLEQFRIARQAEQHQVVGRTGNSAPRCRSPNRSGCARLPARRTTRRSRSRCSNVNSSWNSALFTWIFSSSFSCTVTPPPPEVLGDQQQLAHSSSRRRADQPVVPAGLPLVERDQCRAAAPGTRPAGRAVAEQAPGRCRTSRPARPPRAAGRCSRLATSPQHRLGAISCGEFLQLAGGNSPSVQCLQPVGERSRNWRTLAREGIEIR